jgi:hypothetical protein
MKLYKQLLDSDNLPSGKLQLVMESEDRESLQTRAEVLTGSDGRSDIVWMMAELHEDYAQLIVDGCYRFVIRRDHHEALEAWHRLPDRTHYSLGGREHQYTQTGELDIRKPATDD